MWIIAAYLGAVVMANLVVAHYGPISAIPVALVAIGFDLTSRDALHERWRENWLWPKLAILIFSGSAISFAINHSALWVSIASMCAFSASGTANSIAYHLFRNKSPRFRVNASNAFSALADSLVFPTIAFGGFVWWITLGQFLAKTAGGAIWFFALRRVVPAWKDKA